MTSPTNTSCSNEHARWAFIFWVILFYALRHVLPSQFRKGVNRGAFLCLGTALFMYEGEVNEILCILPNKVLGRSHQAAPTP